MPSKIQQVTDIFTRQLEALRIFDMAHPGAPIWSVSHLSPQESDPTITFDGQSFAAKDWVLSTFGDEGWFTRGPALDGFQRVHKHVEGVCIDIYQAYQSDVSYRNPNPVHRWLLTGQEAGITLAQGSVRDIHPACNPLNLVPAIAEAKP